LPHPKKKMEVLDMSYITMCKYNKTLNYEIPSIKKHSLWLYALWYPK